jgi:hypothetical protein
MEILFNEFTKQIAGRTPDGAQRKDLPSYPDKVSTALPYLPCIKSLHHFHLLHIYVDNVYH